MSDLAPLIDPFAMGMEIDGVTIYTAGEWIALARSYADPAAEVPGVLTAWSLGEEVDPVDVYFALDLHARLSTGATEQTHALLDRGLERLRAAFPQVAG